MRLTDDYILVTNCKSNAIDFMKKLEKCAHENGFSFNTEKRNTNFAFENL